jgi:pimeloyl-ACP methyl ester carboxylesterase
LSRRSSRIPGVDSRGALGLNTLYAPSNPLIDFVFVHGLGGGSTKTWCLSEDPTLFWPKEWLPRDPGFSKVQIHSFGYDADWSSSKSTPSLNIHDFGRSLLERLLTSSYVSDSRKVSDPIVFSSGGNVANLRQTPIVFIAHSMGGLVVKQAYVLARHDPSCADLVKRMQAMVFLATPHRGSDMAQLLNKLLRTSTAHHPRSYVTNLERQSEMLALLNDTFRHYASDLTLYSFYESQKTNFVVKSEVIVPRDSAIMGYTGERCSVLNADHRHVCKFESTDDPNYTLVRDVLKSITLTVMERG